MRAMQATTSSTHWGAGRTIFLAGFTAGLADFCYASGMTLYKGGSVLNMWKGVAGGLVGQTARDGGLEMTLLGIALHFFIMFGAATLFYLIARRVRWFADRPLVSGILLGLAFLATMNYVILPLSAIGRPIYVGTETLLRTAFWHIVLAGLPIAWFVSKGLKPAR